MSYFPGIQSKVLGRQVESKGVAFSGYYRTAAARGIRRNREHWSIERAIIDAFEREIWVFKSVNTIATDSSGLPYVAHDGEDLIEDHPLYRVLNKKANHLESGEVLRKRLSSQVLLSERGAFVHKVKSNGGTIKELHLLPSNRVEIIPGTDGELLSHYEFTRLNGSLRNFEPDEVMWFRDPHPTDPYRAVTPLAAAGISIELSHYARLYNVSFMQNDGRPGGVLGVRDSRGGTGNISETDMNRIEARFGKGPVEAGKLSVIAGELSYVDLAASPRDMQYGQTSATSKSEILGAFGMSEVVLGNASGRCVDDQTEALTQRGWVNGWDLTTDDTILSMDPADGQLKWSPIHEVYRNPAYDGEMYRLNHRHADFFVTPGHNWAVETRPSDRRAGEDRPFTLRKVEELSTHDRIQTIGSAEASVTEAAYSTAFVEVAGWAVTEGYFAPNEQTKIARPGHVTPYVRIRQNEGENADRIRAALKEAGARFGEHVADGRVLFNVSGEVAAALHHVAPGKVLSKDFLLALTAEQREVLLRAMLDADGCRQQSTASWTFAQKDEQAAEAFVFLATLCGYTTSKRVREYAYTHKGITVVKHDHIVVVRQRKVMTIQRDTRTVEHYRGLVWCPRTDYGTFVARRNGKVVLTGNTFDNADAELYNYWTRTVPAHNRILLDGFDEDAGDDVVGSFDTSGIEVLERNERKKREEMRTEVSAGLRSIKSYADKAGYGDEIEETVFTRSLYIPNGKTPLPSKEEDIETLGLGTEEAPDPDGGTPPGAPPPGADPAAPPVIDEEVGAAPGEPSEQGDAAALGVDMAAMSAMSGKSLGGGARPKVSLNVTISSKAALWVEGEADEAAARALEAQIAAALEPLVERWVEVAATRLEGAKQRKGTRHWVPEFEHDTRVGTKALDTARAADEEQWQEEAEEAVSPLVTAAAIAVVVAILLSTDVTPPTGKTIRDLAADLVKEFVRDLVRLVGKSAARQARMLARAANRIDQEGGTLSEVIESVRQRAQGMRNWAASLAENVGASTVTTATNRALEEAAAAEAIEVQQQWVTRRDDRVRDSHRLTHNQRQPLGTPFVMGSGASLRFPRDPLGPLNEVINCFPADTLVAGAPDGAYRRSYSGPMVKIVTSEGKQLTGTPNHPVLTRKGWVALGDLQEGDQLVTHRRQADAPVGHDIDTEPAPIGEVFNALAVTGDVVRVDGGRVNFHGEHVADGDVDVVPPDRLLADDVESSADEFVRQFLLPAPDAGRVGALLGRQGAAHEFLVASLPTTHGGVGTHGVFEPALGSEVAHPDPEGVGAAAGGHAFSNQEGAEGVATDSHFASKALLGLPGEIAVDQVASVGRVESWSGHVYNLSTITGAYSANGIVVHNCRCWLRYRHRRSGRFISMDTVRPSPAR